MSAQREVWTIWWGMTSGLWGLSYARTQSFAVKISPDLWRTLLLLGCLPSLTNLINVFSMLMLATVPEFAQPTKDLRSSTKRWSILSYLQVYLPCFNAIEQPLRICLSVGFEKPHRQHFKSTKVFPHLLRLSEVGRTLWVEFKRNFKSSWGMEYINEFQLRSAFRTASKFSQSPWIT